MKMKILLLASVLAFANCSKKAADTIKKDDDTPKEETVTIEGGKVIVTPPGTSSPFRNPMMGLRDVFSVGLDPIPANYPLPFGSMYKEYIPWDKIENVASDGVDKIVAYSNHRWAGIEKKNIKVIPRVYLHWMGTPPVNDPDKLDGLRFPSDIPYTDASPYPLVGGYFHPDFQKRVAALVKKMGEAWDNDPRVAYVEMGIIGQWGEQHSPMIGTDWKPHDAPSHVANVTWIPGIEKTLGDAFTAAFKNKKVMVRYAYDFTDYQFGYYWDSWAIAEEDDRGYGAMMQMGDRWKSQVIGGEICWNWGDFTRYKSLTEILANTDTRNKIIKQIRDLHANHLGYFSYARPEVNFSETALMENAQILQKALGYRFVIQQFSYTKRIDNQKTFDVTLKVKNEGSSPFYYNWPIEISLLDKTSRQKVWSKVITDAKISEWMPGENWNASTNAYTVAPKTYEVSRILTLDKDLAAGDYIVAVAVLDPAGMTPSLRFATSNYYKGGLHPMGYVGVNKEASAYTLANSFDNIFTDITLGYKVN